MSEPFPFVLISLMDAWDVMFGCSTQHLMDQLKVHITRKSWFRAPYFDSPSSDGADYNNVSGEFNFGGESIFSGDFIFSSGSTDGDSECVDVDIVNDGDLEATEFFTFAMFPKDSAVNVCVPSADVYIEDEDGKCIYFVFG